MKKSILFMLLNVSLTWAIAQRNISATCGEATGNGGSMQYSVGQLVYSTHLGENGSVAEGVQQPYEISVVMGIVDAEPITCQHIVFPNPTNHSVTIKINGSSFRQIEYSLATISGQVQQKGVFESEEKSLNMQECEPGIYFLHLRSENKEIKVFKIIKN